MRQAGGGAQGLVQVVADARAKPCRQIAPGHGEHIADAAQAVERLELEKVPQLGDSRVRELNRANRAFGRMARGLRLAATYLPRALVERLIAQQAALAAFSAEAMAIHESRRDAFRRRRDQLCAGLRSLGFTVPVLPGGAFYLYVDISISGVNSHDFCWRLIDE